MHFKDPWLLVLIPLVFLIGWMLIRKNRNPGFRFPSVDLFQGIKASWKTKFRLVPTMLRVVALVLFVIALAGPRKVLEQTIHKTEGIDIVLALDASGSMAGEDFEINGQRENRLLVVKNVLKEFIAKRTSDRMALVAFGGLAYTVCPLTTDEQWLLENLERIQLGMLEDGTAVGSGISSSLNRLKNSKAKSKVIILLTDGMNNAGKIEPLTAAKIAKSMNVKIYTIGAGSKGYVPFPVQDILGRKFYQNIPLDLDEETLREVARITNGRYFRATDTESLRQIYAEIDKLEKSAIEEIGYKEYKELFSWFLLAGLFCLVFEVILSNSLLMRVP